MTAKMRSRNVEQVTAQRERTNSRSRVSAEGKPRKEVRFQDKVAEDDVEEPKREILKEMLELIRRAREAEKAESVARSSARRMPGAELPKPEIICRSEPEDGNASPISSVGSSTPEKPRLLQPVESVAREVSLTPENMTKITEVMSPLTKSQKEAQERSDSVMELAAEIKQL